MAKRDSKLSKEEVLCSNVIDRHAINCSDKELIHHKRKLKELDREETCVLFIEDLNDRKFLDDEYSGCCLVCKSQIINHSRRPSLEAFSNPNLYSIPSAPQRSINNPPFVSQLTSSANNASSMEHCTPTSATQSSGFAALESNLQPQSTFTACNRTEDISTDSSSSHNKYYNYYRVRSEHAKELLRSKIDKKRKQSQRLEGARKAKALRQLAAAKNQTSASISSSQKGEKSSIFPVQEGAQLSLSLVKIEMVPGNSPISMDASRSQCSLFPVKSE